jgi:hypothetical protein
MFSAEDVLVAEEISSFYIEGQHAVVLPRHSRMSLATSATEQATWIAIHSGEVWIDPGGSGGARWVVSNDESPVSIEKSRSRIAVARTDTGLGITALSDSIRLSSGLGSAHRVRVGEEWKNGAVALNARIASLQSQLTSHRPGERSVFVATCDAEDVARGRWSLSTGLLDQERAGKTKSA